MRLVLLLFHVLLHAVDLRMVEYYVVFPVADVCTVVVAAPDLIVGRCVVGKVGNY